jgi:hypothetical protein
MSLALCVGLGFLVRLRFALRSLAVWRVRAVAPGFIFGWRAFSSVSLCKSIKIKIFVSGWQAFSSVSLCKSIKIGLFRAFTQPLGPAPEQLRGYLAGLRRTGALRRSGPTGTCLLASPLCLFL